MGDFSPEKVKCVILSMMIYPFMIFWVALKVLAVRKKADGTIKKGVGNFICL